MAKTPLSSYDQALDEIATEGLSVFKPPVQQTERRPSQSAGSVPQNLMPLFDSASSKYKVPVNVILALAEQESGFNPTAVGQPTKWGRAKGLMQYLDTTAANMGINPYDPAQAIDAAARQIRERLDKGYSMEDAVKEHFAGPNRNMWGAKTAQYGVDVMRRAQKFLNGIAGGPSAATQQPQEQQSTLDPYPRAKSAMEDMDIQRMRSEAEERKMFQADLDELNKDEPGRFSVPTEEQLRAYYEQLSKEEQQTKPIDVQGEAQKAEALRQSMQQPTGQEQGNKDGNFLTDTANLLWSGVNTAAEDMQELVRRVPGVGPAIVDSINRADKWLSGKTSDEIFKETDQAIEKRWTPEMLAARKKEFVVEGKDGYSFGPAWSDPRSYYSGLVESLPETVMTMGPAGRLAKGAYTSMIARGATRAEAARRAATVATVAGGFMEGGLGGAASSRQVRDEINSMTPDQLKDSEVMKGLMSDGMTFEQARSKLADDSATKAFVLAGVTTGIFGGMGDRALAKIITNPVMGRVKSAAKGFVAEGLLEEVPQSAAQQASENYAMQGADPSRPLSKGVANAAAQGLAVGGIMGAGMGAAAPHVSADAPAAESTQAEAEPADTAPQGSDLPTVNFGDDVAPEGYNGRWENGEPVIEITGGAETPKSSGPLGRALERSVTQAAEMGQEIRATGHWFGEPGSQQTVSSPGIDPFKATVESYAPNGDVILRDENGEVLQVGPDEIEAAKVAAQEYIAQQQENAEPADAEKAPAETAPQQVAPEQPQAVQENVDPSTGEILDPVQQVEQQAAPAQKSYDEMDEGELRQRLKYLATQAKLSGWDNRLTAERRKVEAAIDAKTANLRNEQPANSEVPAQPQPDNTPSVQRNESGDTLQQPGTAPAADEAGAGGAADVLSVPATADANPALNKDGSVKWFGRRQKAEDFIAKNGLADTHEIRQVDRRFEIHPKAEATSEAAAEPAAQAEQKPVKGRVPGGPRVNRARKLLGAEVGEIVVPQEDVGYAKGGTSYKIDRIEKNGTVHVTNTETGSGTTLSLADMERAHSRKVGFERQQVESTAVEPEQTRADVMREMEQDDNADSLQRLNDAVQAGAISPADAQVITERAMAAAKKERDRSVAGDYIDEAVQRLTGKVIFPEDASTIELAETGKRVRIDRAGPLDVSALGKPQQERVDNVAEKETATIEAQQPATATAAPEYGANNKLVSQDRAAELRKKLKAKFSQLNSGIDPEILAIGTELAVFHIEASARKFADFARAMAADLDMPLSRLRPYLRSWYNGARDMMEDSGISVEGMDSPEAVRAELAKLDQAPVKEETPAETAAGAENQAPGKQPARNDSLKARPTSALDDMVAQFDEEVSQNVSSTRSSVEQNSGNADDAVSGVQAADVDDGRGNASRPGRASEGTESERGAGERNQRVPDDGTAAGGARSDQRIHQPNGEFRLEGGATRSAERAGSSRDSGAGSAVERGRAESIVGNAPKTGNRELDQRIAAQRKADKTPTKWGDKESIDAALPLLLPAQREDVLKVEQQHAKMPGILITNGTGTGKTASGMGVAKRYANAGKDNILIAVPTDKIAADWVKFGAMMGLKVKQLEGVDDNGGSGPVITTYANMAQNDALAQRDWDLIIPDEAHYLSSNEKGENTAALDKLRALSGHHAGFHDWMKSRYAKEWKAIEDASEKAQKGDKEAKARMDRLQEEWNERAKPLRQQWQERWAKQEDLTKVVFLSATPFAYVKNVDYAEGYLFNYTPPAEQFSSRSGGGYNSGNAYQSFFMQHFGYRMRYNKLTQPEAGVNSELMEQNFNQWLKDTGALTGRTLDVPHDYDRKFALIDDAAGRKLDEALKYLNEAENGRYRPIYEEVMRTFDYQRRMFLLESMKARAAVQMIKQHLALGRKVVVFHDYNKGGGFSPFAEALPNIKPETREEARQLFQHPRFRIDFRGLYPAIDTITKAFPDALLFNGTVSKAQRRRNADLFNDDKSRKNLIVVQSDAGREGVSLHDTSGKHQRVLINLGMPVKPVAATQIEGRIYRTGQASDAVFRYLTTGTAWEASAFASKIAERASTAENLALGTEARGLKQSFIDAYNDADVLEASSADGKGGKEYDRSLSAGRSVSPFQKAKTFYYAQQKNTKRRDQREGADYYATPEPVGMKMVEWADIKPGDKVLEPSSGHGAIARFFPDQTDVTMVEPSYDLSQRAALANGTAKIVNSNFEDFHITNKFDAIVMNPPYGNGGKTAIEHVAKAGRHLREGGRIVALIPRGGMADRRLNQFLGGEESKGLHLVAKINMPSSTFERAGTAVNTQVVVLEKHSKDEDAQGIQQHNIDLSNAENVNELFDRIENLSLPQRQELTADEAIANAVNNPRYSVSDVRSSITSGELGSAVNSLMDAGQVVIHQQAPEGVPNGTQAWTDEQGAIHLVAERLNPSNAMSVLLHEAFHAGANPLVGEARWKNLNDRFERFLRAAESRSDLPPTNDWERAYARIMIAEGMGDQMTRERAREELAAYAVENFERMPPGIRKWVQAIIGAVKEFIATRFGKQLGEVTPGQLRAMAKAALRSGSASTRQETTYSNAGMTASELATQLREEFEGLKLGLTGNGNIVTLSRIVVHESARNEGTGSQIMQRIVEWADQNGKTVALSPSGDFGGNKTRLVSFYKRFGFIENKGSNKDYEISETMYREPGKPANRYSVSDGGTPSDGEVNSWISQKLDATKELSDQALKTAMPTLLHWTPSRFILTRVGKDIPALKEYADTKLAMDTFRDDWHAKTDKLAQRWTKYRAKNRKENGELMALMHETTLAQVDPSEDFAPSVNNIDLAALRGGDSKSEAFQQAQAKVEADKVRRRDYDALKERFDKLSPEAQELYRDVRDIYSALANTQEQIIIDNLQKAMEYRVKEAERDFEDEMQRIRDEGLKGQEATDAVEAAKKRLENARKRDAWNRKARITKLRQEFESNRLAGPYFPLSRFGDFFVTARDKATGEVVSFSRMESAREQTRIAKELKAKGYDVEEGVVSKSTELRKQVPPDFVARIEDILKDMPASKETQDQVWQLYLQTMPDYSLRKNRIHRKGRAGFEEDALRAFASHMFHGAHQTARLKYAMDLADLLDVARRQTKNTRSPVRSGLVVNQIEKNHQYVMNPTSNRISQIATQGAFMWFLAQSPASALVNMAQTFIIGVPKLAAFHGSNTAKGMAIGLAETSKALGDITRGGFFAEKSAGVTEDEKKALDTAYRIGLITRTQSHDVAGIADSGIKYTAARAKVMAALSWMFHHGERVNREATFLAAYRMAKRKGYGHELAIDKAAQLTWDTHYDYQNTSRPAVMHSNTGKALLVFRNYTLNMLADLAYNTYSIINPRNAAERKEARTQMLGIGTMLAFNAGIRGLPLYGIAMMIAGMFSDDGEDPETELKKTLLEYMPPSLVGMMMDGVPGYAMGIDLSQRIGFGDLWFRSDDRDREGQEAYNYWVQQVLGASVAIPANWVRGVGQISDGYTWRGIETLVPKAIRDPMKAYRYYSEGATTKLGDPIVDNVNGWDIFKQAIGFTPAAISEQYKLNNVNMNKQKAILEQRTKLLSDYYKADAAGDEAKLDKIGKQMDEFSDKYPEMQIDNKTIRRSIRNRERYRDSNTGGMSYNDNLRDRLLEEQPAKIYR